MNNSKFLIDNLEQPAVPDNSETLRTMEERTVRILEAIEAVQKTDAWSSLKDLVFNDLAKRLETELLREAKRTELDDRKLNRLAGQLQWADRYADLGKLYAEFRLELTRIRTILHGKQNSGGSA